MTEIKIKKSVEQAFTDMESRAWLNDYLNTIRENLRITEDKFQHSYQIVLLLIVIFELLTRAAISEVTVGPIKVSDLRLFRKLLPAVLAYMYYSTMSSMAMRRFLIETHSEIMKRYYAPIYNNNLEHYLLPTSTFITEDAIIKSSQNKLSKLVANLSFPLIVVIIFAPIVFEVYAFYSCFSIFGISDILVWLCLLASIPFLIQGFIFFLQIERFIE